MRFSDVVGHADLGLKLREGVRKGRVAHAQLFLGKRGSGNLPLALAYARFLLCDSPGSESACGRCTSCLSMDKLEHPDIHFSFPIRLEQKKKTCDLHIQDWREQVLQEPYLDLDTWSDHHAINKNVVIGVDEVGAINTKLSLRSYMGGYKVVLIWYPERMNPAAANKLLKSIEEPPENTVFLLVSEDAGLLLPTIVSRTQQLLVPAVDSVAIQAYLISQRGLDEQSAHSIAVRSEGNVLEANLMAVDSENSMLPIFRGWMLSCYYQKVSDTKEVCESFHALGREGQKRFIRYGLQKIRQCVLYAQGVDELVHAVHEEKMFLEKFKDFIDLDTAEWFQEEFDRMHAHLDRNASGKVMFMDTSFQLYQRLRR